jgi:hypothetical protein
MFIFGIKFLKKSYLCYYLLPSSSSVPVTGVLAEGPRLIGNPWIHDGAVVTSIDVVSRVELPLFASCPMVEG